VIPLIPTIPERIRRGLRRHAICYKNRRLLYFNFSYNFTTVTAGAVSTRRRMKSYEEDDVVTPALAALKLYDRDVERVTRGQPATSGGAMRMTGTDDGSRLVAAESTSLRVFPDFRSCRTSGTAGARLSQSAKRRSSVAGEDARHDAGMKQSPAFIKTGVSRVNSSPTDRSAETLRRTSATGSTAAAAASAGNPSENTSTSAGGTDVSHGGKRSSVTRWKKDLRVEVPPALYGCRRSHTFHVVMSTAERRRRLVALQTRQMAHLSTRRLHAPLGKVDELYT